MLRGGRPQQRGPPEGSRGLHERTPRPPPLGRAINTDRHPRRRHHHHHHPRRPRPPPPHPPPRPPPRPPPPPPRPPRRPPPPPLRPPPYPPPPPRASRGLASLTVSRRPSYSCSWSPWIAACASASEPI